MAKLVRDKREILAHTKKKSNKKCVACVLILGGVRTGYGPGGTVDMTFCHVSNVDWLRAPQSSVVRCMTWSIFWLNKPNLALFVCFFAFINLRQIFTINYWFVLTKWIERVKNIIKIQNFWIRTRIRRKNRFFCLFSSLFKIFVFLSLFFIFSVPLVDTNQ